MKRWIFQAVPECSVSWQQLTSFLCAIWKCAVKAVELKHNTNKFIVKKAEKSATMADETVPDVRDRALYLTQIQFLDKELER